MKLLYEQAHFPVFQNRMYESERAAMDCPQGEIRLVEDLRSGLVYNDAFRPELMAYDGRYQNEQGVSQTFRQHLDEVADLIAHHLGPRRLVEVGCGKGFFLEMLLGKGFDITGFDPTYEGQNPRIRQQYFGPGVIDKAEGLILRHVLEHVPRPVDFLAELKTANSGSGRIYIEVPCFDWICEHRAWFDIFYEHVNYFRMSDFSRMFGKILQSGYLFGKQYLYVIAELSSLRAPLFDPGDAVQFPSDFCKSVETPIAAQDAPLAVWGGASKGVIFSLLKKRAGQPVSVVVDINPAKQGKYLPGTGLKVLSPREGLAVLPLGAPIFVMNSNYLEEIKALSNNNFNYIPIDHD